MREKKKRERPLAQGVLWALAGVLCAISSVDGQDEIPEGAGGGGSLPISEETTSPSAWGWGDVVEALSGLHFASRGVKLDRQNDIAEVVLAGGVDWTYRYRGEPVRVQADRILILVRNLGLKPSSAASEDGSSSSSLRIGEGSWADFTFYAEGNVRLELPALSTHFDAETIYYEHLATVGVMTGVSVSTSVSVVRTLNLVLDDRDLGPTFETPEAPSADDFAAAPFRFSASRLHFYGFDVFEGRDVLISNCDYGIPHFAVKADSMTMRPVGADSAPRDVDRGAADPAVDPAVDPADRMRAAASRMQNFIIDPDGSSLAVQGHSVAPLPVSHWDTRWNDFSAIRSAEGGRSSQYGAFFGVDWNLNYFLNQVPLENFAPLKLVDDDTYLGFVDSGVWKT